MFIGGEDQHELSRRRVDFLFLEVGKRKAHSLVRSEEEGIHWRRRGRLVVGGSVGELLEGQDHSGADLSAEAYDAEARREYGEKRFMIFPYQVHRVRPKRSMFDTIMSVANQTTTQKH